MSPPLRSRRRRWITLCLLGCACAITLWPTFGDSARKEFPRGQAVPRTKEPRREGTDLLIKSIRLHDTGYVEYEILNRGTRHAGQFIAEIYIGNEYRHTIKHRGVTAGQTERIVSDVARVDNFCRGDWVRIEVDTQNIVREYNERNNARRLFVRSRCPDLTVEKFQSGYRAGKWRICTRIVDLRTKSLKKARYKVLARIQNQGKGASPTTKVVLLAGSRRGKFKKTVVMIRPLRPGESAMIETTQRFTKTIFGTKARVIVDVENQVAESNEKNNSVRVDQIIEGSDRETC